MSKEYKEGFKDGFKEGWKAALKQSKIVDYPVMPTVPPAQWPTYALDGCSICGRKGPHSVVCTHPQCPTRVTATGSTIVPTGGHVSPLGSHQTMNDSIYATGAIGAAGSVSEFYGAGANGATGY